MWGQAECGNTQEKLGVQLWEEGDCPAAKDARSTGKNFLAGKGN